MNIVNDLGENIRREHWKSALQNWNPAQPKWAAPDVNCVIVRRSLSTTM
jgi:hypothetical protein